MKEKKDLNKELIFNNDSRRVNILGVGIDPVTKNSLNLILSRYLTDGSQHFISTVNPEFIMQALSDKRFKEILGYSDLNLADGIGILWAAKFLSLKVPKFPGGKTQSRTQRIKKKKQTILKQAFKSLALIVFNPSKLKTVIPQRITGVDLIENLIKFTEKGDHSIFILGGEKGIARRAKFELEKKYPQVLITGTRWGYLQEGVSQKVWIDAINKVRADILVVALGSPKQEKWIFKNMDQLPFVRVAVGVGGAVDYISKKKLRAPQFLRKIGLEWLFRLLLEPKRSNRIRKATYQFIKKIITHKISQF
jgi:N-acetylglucosaminyldiphosphoundecaprenol N-acetyl-beta-D-mannosaminyltransferase